jgi:hypothetical protein
MPDQTPIPVALRPEPHPAHSFAIDVAKIAVGGLVAASLIYLLWGDPPEPNPIARYKRYTR